MKLPEYVVSELYEKCSTQKQAMAWARHSGYHFSDRAFRALWASVAGGSKSSYQPSLWPEPAAPASAVGRQAGVEEADELPEEAPVKAAGQVKAQDVYRQPLQGKRFVFTCAQNNTLIHEGFFKSLVEFCRNRDAKLGVSRITYNIAGWNKRSGISHISKKKQADVVPEMWYDHRLDPYWLDDQVKVADGLLFCGELDILPTMQHPLNGLDNYTGTNSAIVPHVKMHMRSLASMKHDDAKFLYTTGTCTLRNYINRRLGQIASFNHVYGALYVEVDEEGEWFVRQLNADDTGCFYDLNEWFTPTGVQDRRLHGFSDRVYVNLGDVHAEKLDSGAWQSTKALLAELEPSKVFVHDLADFESRNHHNTNDPWFLAKMAHRLVEDDIRKAAGFLYDLRGTVLGAEVYIVQSNHDDALTKWLKTPCPIQDAGNAWYWHQLNAWAYKSVYAGESPCIFQKAVHRAYNDLYGPTKESAIGYFVGTDESLVFRDIEFGMHGHLGPNGMRGNPAGFRQLGRKANTGHTHSAGIIDGVWTAGVLATLNMGYNVGPSSWSHSHIVTYPNGKRTIITIKRGKWRA